MRLPSYLARPLPSVAGFFGMNPPSTPITNRLRRAQGDSDATLHLLHQLGRVELYQRQRPRRATDFAVVRGRLVGHGASPAEALAQVRAELLDQRAALQRPLTWRDGLEAGLSSHCLYQFCQAYPLDPHSQLTPAQLRQLVAPPGTPHRQTTIRALRRFGIHLK